MEKSNLKLNILAKYSDFYKSSTSFESVEDLKKMKYNAILNVLSLQKAYKVTIYITYYIYIYAYTNIFRCLAVYLSTFYTNTCCEDL